MKAPLIEVVELTVSTAGGRILFADLNLCLEVNRVAIVGRNGVGKSTLLSILAGDAKPDRGEVILRCDTHFVQQQLGKTEPLSHGEIRKRKLCEALQSSADMLLLDEPTQDLDEAGVTWLRESLSNWQGGLLAATHDRRLLQDFRNFFVIAESGCRYFEDTFSELEIEMEKERIASELRYSRNLNQLIAQEEHTAHVARRRRRKKQYGRVRELGRATPRQRLNQKRDYAQVKHGRMARIREERLDAIREWAKSTRRALHVTLPLELCLPELPPVSAHALIILEQVSAVAGHRNLFRDVNLRINRERLGVIGSNGTGKTTLLEIMLGYRKPFSGRVKAHHERIGYIAQGGTNWLCGESLLSRLSVSSAVGKIEDSAKLVCAHKFPLALAERPMKSLSPGERVRAALICLMHSKPAIELLVLDEPTYSLDFEGYAALSAGLGAWKGGLVVASHDRDFLSRIRLELYFSPRFSG